MTKTVTINPDSSLSEQENVLQSIAEWASFYRSNVHRFVEDFLHIKLRLFQQLLIVAMNISNYFCYIAARGQWLSYPEMVG